MEALKKILKELFSPDLFRLQVRILAARQVDKLLWLFFPVYRAS